jgi:5,10-methylene-tetrahydrofolate dehydrogenase/methenyl tetrahydrofolate cyclohydrolase
LGLLAKRARTPHAVPCTPAGVMEMLSRSKVPVQGATAVVIGRSDIVGVPVALLLLHANASVQILHSKTPPQVLQEAVAKADIVVACVGVAALVKGEWIKKGACVIDVGINSVADASKPRGYSLVGDVDFEGASKRAAKITPVPGGVGPMTIAMLLKNTVALAKAALEGGAGPA